jgi:transposase
MMSKVTTLQERIEIMDMAQAGYNDQHITQALQWSPSTIRKWRRRAQTGGRAALATRMGRPLRGALSSYPQAMREQLLHWRSAHPGWGAKTLQAELGRHPRWQSQRLPSIASIARLLAEQGMSRCYERHSPLPPARPAGIERAHQVWELDAKGYQRVEQVGYISLINLNDRFTHARLLSYPCPVGRQRWQRHPNTEDYQCALRLAFTTWGLPEQLQVDHGAVFIDNKSKSPFPTRLHLWLLALGIEVRFGRVAQPRDQAMTERSHQLWDAQCLKGQVYASWEHLYHSLQQRRHFLNHLLPCRSLDHQPPLQAHPQARRSPRAYRPEWEARLLDLQRVWSYLAQGRWYRRVSSGGTITLAQQLYYLGHRWARQEVEITFDAHTQQLICYTAAGDCIASLAIQGISIPALMGQLADHLNLPAFQLALPFTDPPPAVLRLFEPLAV